LIKCPLSTYIDIPQWDPSKNDIQTYTICSAAYNYSSTVPTWASMESNTTALWNVCDAPAGMTFPIMGKLIHCAGKRLTDCVVFITLAPFVITYLVIFLGFFVFLATWLVYKSMGEKVRMNHDMHRKNSGAGWIKSACKTRLFKLRINVLLLFL
jgi:hypothetical protein